MVSFFLNIMRYFVKFFFFSYTCTDFYKNMCGHLRSTPGFKNPSSYLSPDSDSNGGIFFFKCRTNEDKEVKLYHWQAVSWQSCLDVFYSKIPDYSWHRSIELGRPTSPIVVWEQVFMGLVHAIYPIKYSRRHNVCSFQDVGF